MKPCALGALAVLIMVLGALFGEREARGDEGRYATTVHARPKRDEPTHRVVTAKEMIERGVNNLAEALELMPEVVVRQGGRGEFRVDLRGAKQRSALVLIDGVPVDEPWFGSFDLASIPVTDLVEIRVTLSPASPLEGPGGDGGLIEVFTLRATGGRRIDARLRGATTPDGQAAVTGRLPLGRGFALRASAGGRYGVTNYPIVTQDGTEGYFADTLGQVHSALRLEYVHKLVRVTADGFYQHRGYYVPPTQDTGADMQYVKAEDAVRAVLGVETERRGWRVAAGAYTQHLVRDTDYFEDATLKRRTGGERLQANRTGAAVHVDKQLARVARISARVSVDHEQASDKFERLPLSQGSSTFGMVAVGAQVLWRWLRLDAAVGAGIPFTSAQQPWPEAKLSASFALHRAFELQVIGARKGRVPTLREQFAPEEGNLALAPEQSTHAEVRVMSTPHRLIHARLSAYYRLTEGLIRLSPDGTYFQNLDNIHIKGMEAVLEIARGRRVGGGITYILADPDSPTLGLYPIDNFPRHRVDAYLQTNLWGKGGALLRVRYIDDRRDRNMVVARYALVDFAAWAKVTNNIRVTMRVDNLTDERYQVRAGFRSIGIVGSLALEGVWE